MSSQEDESFKSVLGGGGESSARLKVANKWLKEKGNELMHRMYLIDEK